MKFRYRLLGMTLATALLSTTSANAQMTNLCNGCSTQINAHGVCLNVANGTGASLMIPWNSPGEWASFYNRGIASIWGCAPPPPPPMAAYGAGFGRQYCYGEGCYYDVYVDVYGGSGNYRIYTEASGGAIAYGTIFGDVQVEGWPYGYGISMSGNRATAGMYIHITGGTMQIWIYDNVTGQVATAQQGFGGY